MDGGGPEPPHEPSQPAWRKYAWLIVALLLAAIALHGIITHPPKHQATPVDGGAPPVEGAH
jgi:hypothetical protein